MNPQPPPRERPILFSAPMVRAILDGRKTQTRRVIKPQPVDNWLGNLDYAKPNGEGCSNFTPEGLAIAFSPHGQPGERLWVRETFHPHKSRYGPASYRATWPNDDDPPDDGWKPAILMPRKFTRITLELTAVRVQRVQEISDGDAFAEGVGSAIDRISTHFPGKWINLYRDLWDTIHKKRGFIWDANPFVWALTFKRV